MPPKPTPARNRPAVNFTIDSGLKKIGDDTATDYGLFTAQGGDQRPRFSGVVSGLLLMLRRGQIDRLQLFDASYESVGIEPDANLRDKIQTQERRVQHATE